ncbi:MAG: hypothetical protein AAGG38_03185 [Planctomycetota bacterium]
MTPLHQAVLSSPAEAERWMRSEAQAGVSGVRDYAFLPAGPEADPGVVFDRLRWGGQVVFTARRAEAVEAWVRQYDAKPEWTVETGTRVWVTGRYPWLRRGAGGCWPRGLRRILEQRSHYAVARKVLIDPVDRLSTKHSYDVRLVRSGAGGGGDWVVRKSVPTMEQAVSRLMQTCPGVAADRLIAIAAKLVRKVFPVFLTREAAILKLLQRDLPERFRGLTPRLLSMETEGNGLAKSITMRWLRQGGEPLSQSDFARQAAALLRSLHEDVGVMHLDLRLDNMVVAEAGVSIVDFGSAVRIGEDLSTNPMIETLVREMLGASQVTRDLERHRRKGLVRAGVFVGLPYPPTPAFDLFALATNLTRPHDNPEFKGLVRYDRSSEEAQRLSRVRRQVLLPKENGQRPIKTVGELFRALATGRGKTAGQAVAVGA